MKILGVSSNHDAGAAVVENGRIVAAINEERLNRRKLYWGPPLLSVQKCLEIADSNEIDVVAFASLSPGAGLQRQFRNSQLTWQKRLFDSLSYLHFLDKRFVRKAYLAFRSRYRKEPEVSQFFQQRGLKAPCGFTEHHLCHAATAYYTSPFQPSDKVLVVTTDGSGDGLCAAVFTVNKDGFLERRHETSFYHSPASCFYSNVTCNLGFKPLRHEGKITGLAAYGDSTKTLSVFRRYLVVDLKKLEYRSRLGCYGRPAARKLHLALWGQKREDIAAGLQKRIEEVVTALIGEAAKRYECDKVCLAGGLFANVKLNQAIYELPGIADVYVHPHMGDGGVAVGAALTAWVDHCKRNGRKAAPQKLDHVYLGCSFDDDEIEAVLKNAGVRFVKYSDVEANIARLLAEGKVVARFNGAMEYGPRALGNRSILYQPTDPTINDWLNKRLHRTEFMPFAPIVLFEEAPEYFKGFDPRRGFASELMTITYEATERCKKNAPAVVHIDGTARPQTIRRDINPSMHKIIEEYKKITGLPIMINTSFNIHEEPIVCTPQDAIRAFQIGNLDVLAIGNFIIK